MLFQFEEPKNVTELAIALFESDSFYFFGAIDVVLFNGDIVVFQAKINTLASRPRDEFGWHNPLTVASSLGPIPAATSIEITFRRQVSTAIDTQKERRGGGVEEILLCTTPSFFVPICDALAVPSCAEQLDCQEHGNLSLISCNNDKEVDSIRLEEIDDVLPAMFRPLLRSIPSQVALLDSLRILKLSPRGDDTARFTGVVPSQLGLMTNLEELEFINQAVSGPLPTQLGRLTKLRRFRIGNNQKLERGPFFDISGWVNLRALHIAHINRVGLAPNVSAASRLAAFVINSNYFFGPPPLFHPNVDPDPLFLQANAFEGSLDTLILPPEYDGKCLVSFNRSTDFVFGTRGCINRISNCASLVPQCQCFNNAESSSDECKRVIQEFIDKAQEEEAEEEKQSTISSTPTTINQMTTDDTVAVSSPLAVTTSSVESSSSSSNGEQLMSSTSTLTGPVPASPEREMLQNGNVDPNDSLLVIIGASVGGVVALLCLGALVFLAFKKNKSGSTSSSMVQGESERQVTNASSSNADYGSFASVRESNSNYDFGDIALQKQNPTLNYDVGNLNI